jgi:hypothetical protein
MNGPHFITCLVATNRDIPPSTSLSTKPFLLCFCPLPNVVTLNNFDSYRLPLIPPSWPTSTSPSSTRHSSWLYSNTPPSPTRTSPQQYRSCRNASGTPKSPSPASSMEMQTLSTQLLRRLAPLHRRLPVHGAQRRSWTRYPHDTQPGAQDEDEASSLHPE